MALVLFLVAAASLLLGTAEVSLHKIVALVSGTLNPDDPARLIILRIRLPRIILAGLAGFSLALGGVVFHALPLSSTAKIEKQLTLTLSIQAGGTVFLDKEPMTLESLTGISFPHQGFDSNSCA
jgi:ABC-type enterochelin transport system permease subunit